MGRQGGERDPARRTQPRTRPRTHSRPRPTGPAPGRACGLPGRRGWPARSGRSRRCAARARPKRQTMSRAVNCFRTRRGMGQTSSMSRCTLIAHVLRQEAGWLSARCGDGATARVARADRAPPRFPELARGPQPIKDAAHHRDRVSASRARESGIASLMLGHAATGPSRRSARRSGSRSRPLSVPVRSADRAGREGSRMVHGGSGLSIPAPHRRMRWA